MGNRSTGHDGPAVPHDLVPYEGILSPSSARFSMAARPYSAVSFVDTHTASLPGTNATGPLSSSVFQGADSL